MLQIMTQFAAWKDWELQFWFWFAIRNYSILFSHSWEKINVVFLFWIVNKKPLETIFVDFWWKFSSEGEITMKFQQII